MAKSAANPRLGGLESGGPSFGDRVLDLAGALVVVLDREGRIVQFNGACTRTTGYTLGQVKGKRIWDVLIFPDERAAVQAVFEQLRMGLYPNSVENYWRTKKGERRYIAWVNTAILDEAQDVEYIVGSGIDITERKQAEDREREYAGYLAILSEAATSLVRSNTRDNIYRLLAEGLSKLLPQAIYISVGEYSHIRRTLLIKEVHLEPSLAKQAEDLLGKGLKGLELPLGDFEDISKVLSGRFVRLSGLHQATFHSLPKGICRNLERLLGKPQIYGCGLSAGSTLYGTMVVMLPQGAEMLEISHLEAYVNQTSLALTRLDSEQRVQERERHFRALIENAAEIITILEPDGTIRYKSPAVQSELGYRPQELVGQNIFGFVHPDDLASVKRNFEAVLQRPNVPLKAELRFRHRDGTWRVLDITGISLLQDPAVAGIVINSRDVTDRVISRQRIGESEERYRSLVELSPDGCAIHQDGRIVFINASGARLLGASGPEELLGRNFLDLAHPSFRDKIGRRAGRALRSGHRLETIEEKFLRLDGTSFDVEVSAGPITFEGRPAVHVMFRDVTQRQLHLKALQESEARYRTTLDSMGDLIHLIDREGRIIYTNPAFGSYLESLGMDSRILGKKFREAFPFLPDKVDEEYRRVLQTGQTLTTQESTIIGGNEIFTETRKIPVEVGGKVERVVTVIRDVTEKRRAEEEIREGRERFQRLADRIAEGISIYEGGQLVYANERALEIFGCTWDQYRIKGLLDLAAPEERDRLKKQMKESPLGPVPPEQAVFWIVRGDGSKRCLYNRCYYTRKGKESLGYFMVTSDITEKRQNELALIESEKQYRELFENNPNPMWVYDPQTLAFIAVNEAAVRLYGYSREEFAAMTLKDIRPLEDVPVLLEAVARSVKQKFDRTSRVRHRTKDGRLLQVEVVGHSVRFSGQEARLVMINDITERQRIEEAVRDSEEKFRALAEQSPNMIFINQGGRVIYANPVCSELMGYTAEEFYSPDFDFMCLIAPEDREKLGQAYRRHLQGQEVESYEYSLVTKSGQRLEVILNTKLVDLKGGPAIIGIITDITQLRRAQREIDEGRLRLNRLVENMAEGVYRTSEDGRFLDANLAMARIFGYGSVEELMQADIKKDLYFSPDDRLKDYPPPGQDRTRVLRMKRRDGSEVWVEDSCRYVRDSQGQVVEHQGVLRDVTDRHRAEEALKESEEKYRKFFEDDLTGDYLSTLEGKLLDCNPAFAEMLGFGSVDEAIRTPEAHLYFMPEERQHFLDLLSRDGKLKGFEARLKRRDGRHITVIENVVGEFDNEGRLTRFKGYMFDITERKQAEERIRESEERYRLLAEKMPDALFIYEDEKFFYANRAGLDMLGISSFEELAGRSQYDFVHPDYRRFVRQRLAMLKSHGKDMPVMEQKILRGDGAEVDVSVKSTVLPYQGRNMVMSIVRDITELKRAQRALEASEEKYRNLAEASPDMIFVVDRSGLVSYLNTAAARAAGSKPEEAIGAPLSAFFPPEVYRRQWGNIQKVLETGSSLYVEAVTPFGDTVHYLDTWLVPLRSQKGEVESVLGISRDSTDRKRMEQELQESEAKYRQIFEGVSEGIYRSTPDGRPLMANPALVRMLGHNSLEEALERNIEHEGYFDSEVRERYKNMMEEQDEVRDFVNVWRRKDGSELVVRENAHAVRDEKGAILYYEGTVEDITAQEKFQQALRENERRMATLMDNLPGMAYRCRNDRKWTMEFVSRGCLDLTEYTPEELVENRAVAYGDLIVEDDRDMVWDEVQDAVAKGGPFQLLYRITTKSGRLKWIWEQGVAIGSGSTTLEGFVIDISPRMLAEEALFNSEHQYRTTIDAMGDPIHVVDRDLRIVLANEAFKRTNQALGFEAEGVGKPIFEVYPFLDREKVAAEYRQVFETGEMLVTEERHQLSGREIITETRKIPVYEGSRVVRAVTVVRDVTESKLAEQALRESEEKFRSLAETSPMGIFVYREKFVYVNPFCHRLTGYTTDELLQMNFWDLVHPDHRELVKDRGLRRLKGEEISRSYEFKIVRKDGQTRWLYFSAVLINYGGQPAGMGVVEDITERVEAVQALRESEEKYRQVFDGIAEGIYRTTPDGRIEMANPALLKILGYDSLEALQAVDLNQSGYDDPRERVRFKQIMEEQGQVRDFEAIWRRRDGRTVILNENARAVRDQEGRIVFYEGTVEDVTLRKQAEQALVDEKNKLADLFQVSLTVAGTRNIPDKISLTMEGIKDASVFRRGGLVIRAANGSVKHFGHYGLSPEEAERVRSSVVDSEAVWQRLYREGKRISNSFIYRISDGQQVAPGAVLIPSNQGPGKGWDPTDTLIVPLRIGGRKVGYITFDDPKGGEAPTLEEVHLLELFANQLSVSIENLSLYDDLERSYYSTLKAFVAAMEAKDPYTKGHSENVRHYALKIANSMDLPQERINLIDYSALLHDIGKLGIREEILNKPDVLSYDEYQEVKLHPEIGSRMVSDIEMLDRTAHIIHSHHEYFDGQGYPRGIKGEEIPLESRIISVADAFEAMTSDRPYRKAFGKRVAIQRLRESAGKQFDARIVEVLSGIIDAMET